MPGTRTVATPGHLPKDVMAFLHDTSLGDIPADVQDFARRCLIDLLGVAAAGRTTQLADLITDHAAEYFGVGASGRSATIWFDGRTASPVGAALANGMMIDSIDAHDGHKITKGHTGCHQLPALLAFLEAEGRVDDGVEFLTSLVLGYEIATRAGIALHATAPDYHTSGAWGALGCAALGARILGLDAQTTFEAMGIAEYHGPRSQMMRVIDHPTMLKDGSGWGAMAGVSAAYLARDGFTGAPAITVNDPAVDDVWSSLGDRWMIFEQYFKPHPVCRWAQPAVEATLDIVNTHAVDPAQIHRLRIETFHEAARLATVHPTSTEQAQYSLPFPVAAAAFRGKLTAEEVTGESLTNSDILALAAKVEITEDDAHNAAFPANRYARAVVELADGTEFRSTDHEPRGDPENHLSDDEIRAKYRSFATPAVGDARADATAAAVESVVEDGGPRRLLTSIHAPLG